MTSITLRPVNAVPYGRFATIALQMSWQHALRRLARTSAERRGLRSWQRQMRTLSWTSGHSAASMCRTSLLTSRFATQPQAGISQLQQGKLAQQRPQRRRRSASVILAAVAE